MNNEANNGRPFFLVAFHCIDVGGWIVQGHNFPNGIIDPDEISALASAAFQFQYWNTSCSGTTLNSFVAFIGSVVRAQWHNSDGVLLELTDPPGIGDGVNYAGWNRQTSSPSNSLSYIIHHPQTKDMRITTTKKVATFLFNGQFWTAHYSSGTVDKGSSGSALFNENDQVVGQLRSGWSNCNFTSFGDRYGKFSFTWNGGNLQPWLSPSQGLQSTSTLILSPFVIQGNNALNCTGQTQYSVPNLLGATYNWQVSNNLQISSGQGTPTIMVTNLGGSSTGTVTATINTPTKGITRTLAVTKTVTIGSPNSLTGTYSTNTNTYPIQTVNFVSSGYINGYFQWPGVTNITVTASGSGTGFYWYGSNFSFTLASGQSLNLSFNGTGLCGDQVSATRTFVQSGGYAIIVSPNPATSNLNVSITEVIDTTTSSANAQSKTSNTAGITKMYLYDFNTGVLVKQWTYQEMESTNYNLNIVGVKAGAYVLKMERNNKTTSTKILVK